MIAGGYQVQVMLHIFDNPCIIALPAGKTMSLQRKGRKGSLGRRGSRKEEPYFYSKITINKCSISLPQPV